MIKIDLFLDFGFAWISVILGFLLAIIFVLRKLINKNEKYKARFQTINKNLRKHHKLLGIALILTGLIHGLFSSESLFSLNLGTISWVLCVLLGLNFMFRKRLRLNKGWMYYHRILTLGFISVLIFHIYDVGIQAPSLIMASISNSLDSNEAYASTDSSSSSVLSVDAINKQMEDVVLEDGVYEGEATGYHDGLIVSVEIKDNAIISIEIVDHNEQKSRYYQPAIEQVPTEIINRQSLDVDTVSGSTFTSVGIINAVKDALSKALTSGTLPDDLALPTRKGHR